MSINTRVYVGPYLICTSATRESSISIRHCSSGEDHTITDNGSFCPECGAKVEQFPQPFTESNSFQTLMFDLVDADRTPVQQSLVEKFFMCANQDIGFDSDEKEVLLYNEGTMVDGNEGEMFTLNPKPVKIPQTLINQLINEMKYTKVEVCYGIIIEQS